MFAIGINHEFASFIRALHSYRGHALREISAAKPDHPAKATPPQSAGNHALAKALQNFTLPKNKRNTTPGESHHPLQACSGAYRYRLICKQRKDN
jgi:hypothetical protein